MPYNPATDQSIIISKFHHKLLKDTTEKNKRKHRGQIELDIEQSYINAFGYEQYSAIKDAYQFTYKPKVGDKVKLKGFGKDIDGQEVTIV